MVDQDTQFFTSNVEGEKLRLTKLGVKLSLNFSVN